MAMTAENDLHHPQHQPNPYHRKIELQSPLDLSYLQANVARAARAKLDLHFPPSASQPAPATHISLDGPSEGIAGAEGPTVTTDPMRARVEALVDAFLAQTWAGAKQNISVNGLDAHAIPDADITGNGGQKEVYEGEPRENIDFTYTPYDTELQKRVASLHAELEALTTQVSRLRRGAPGDAARRFGEELNAQISAQEQQIRDAPVDVGRVLELDMRGWREETAETYERGLVGLRRLGVGVEGDGNEMGSGSGNGSLTETVGKAQRARTVAMELE